MHEYDVDKDLFIGEAYLHFDANGLLELNINHISQPVAFSKYLVQERYARNVGRKAHDLDPNDGFAFDFDCNDDDDDDDAKPGQFSDADEDENENASAEKVEASHQAQSFGAGGCVPKNVKDFLQKRKTRKPDKTSGTEIDAAKLRLRNSFYRSIQSSNFKANDQNQSSDQNTSISDRHKKFLVNRMNTKREPSKVDILSETSSRKSKMTTNESFQINSSRSDTNSSEKSEVRSQDHSALVSEYHQFLIVHKDLSARKCKPIVKLSDLDQLHGEYYRHVSYEMKLGHPRHEIHKGMNEYK